MAAIVLKLDAYGTYAQRSVVADFVELYAWKQAVTLRELADLIKDRSIRLPPERLVNLEAVEPMESDDPESAESTELPEPATTEQRGRDTSQRDATEDARAVFELVQERADALGTLYPYRVTADALQRIGQTATSYDVALTLTLRHAYRDEATVANEFEAYVEACLNAARWIVFPLGARVRAAKGGGAARFGRVIRRARKELRLPSRGSGRVPRMVHDRGADLLARYPPADKRPGCRTYIFQVTVGASDSWNQKLHETLIASWSDYLGDPVIPSVTLAIPHHAERDHLHELVKNGEGRTVWDRLRLVAHTPALDASALETARAVFEEGAEW